MGKEDGPAYRVIPAARFHPLTPAFDLIRALMGLGTRFAERVVRTVHIPLKARVLEAGCGTGRLARAVKFRCPDAEVIGLDAEPRILTLARRKAARRELAPKFFEGLIEAMSFPDESFDLVFSVLVLHHLPEEVKIQACRENSLEPLQCDLIVCRQQGSSRGRKNSPSGSQRLGVRPSSVPIPHQEATSVTTKEQMIKMIQDLPEDATVEDAMERLYLLFKVGRGIAQADAGQKVSQEEARRRMAQWLR